MSDYLASINDVFVVHGSYKQYNSNSYLSWKAEVSWSNIFALISPYLLQPQNDAGVSLTLAKVLFEKYKGGGTSPSINDQTFQTIKIQLMALNLVEVKSLNTTKGFPALFWCLTKNGREVMMSIRTIKAPKQDKQ